jgi:DNA-binding winged helix-turn-helix (wHTH) protein
MSLASFLSFGSFCLDLENQWLWRDEQPVTLTPKALAVLCYLVERAGQLVTKEDLLANLWPETVMGDGVLKVYMGELRKALLDDPKTPRYIETLHRRRYRFIAPLTTAQPVRSAESETV